MKNLTNKAFVILFAVCLVLTIALSAAMSFSTGAVMAVFGCAALVIGALSSATAAELISRIETAKV